MNYTDFDHDCVLICVLDDSYAPKASTAFNTCLLSKNKFLQIANTRITKEIKHTR